MGNIVPKKIESTDKNNNEDSQYQDWSRLRNIITEHSYRYFEEEILLSSGRTSNFYFNMKTTMSQPEALNLIASLTFDAIENIGSSDYIGGLEMGAIPILNAVSMYSFQQSNPIPLFWIRKKAKDHGTQQLVEGLPISSLKNKKAIMVDDVTTTGKSVLKAIMAAREQNVTITDVITIVDRLEGAQKALADADISLHSLFDLNDFRNDIS